MIRAEEYCLLDCESSVETIIWGLDSESLGVHIKKMLPGESFAISKNQLVLGGQFLFSQ